MGDLIGVTGATGHLGFVVCQTLIRQGYRVRAFCRSEKYWLTGLDIEVQTGDILDPLALQKFAQGCRAIIHCAALISLSGDPAGLVFRTNTIGPHLITEACLKAGVRRLIHVSSTHAVKAWPLNEPFDEGRPYKQSDDPVYDYSKAVGEGLVLDAFRQGRLEVVIVRPSAIVGPYDYRASRLGLVLRQLYARKLPALTAGGYNFIDVRDAAEATVNAIKQARSGQIYLLAGTYHTILELATIAQKVSGRKSPRLVAPFWLLNVLAPLSTGFSRLFGREPLLTREAVLALAEGHPNMINAKARAELGLKIRPLSLTIADFYAWEKERGLFYESD